MGLFSGGSICDTMAIFFSRNYGLVCVYNNEDIGITDINLSLATSTNTQAEASISETVAGNLSLYTLDPEEIMAAYRDTLGQLKAAFIFHVQNQQVCVLNTA